MQPNGKYTNNYMKNTNRRKNRAYFIIVTTLFFFTFHGMATAETNNNRLLYQKNLRIVKEAFEAYGELLIEKKQLDERAEKQINDELLVYVKNLEKWINISFDANELKGNNLQGLARSERKALLISRVNEMTACIFGFNKELKSDSNLSDKLSILSRQISDLEKE